MLAGGLTLFQHNNGPTVTVRDLGNDGGEVLRRVEHGERNS